jgi:organic radical activating enzyme
MVEWEVTLDCNYKCEYCVQSRNSALPIPIKFEKDKNKVFEFIKSLKRDYPEEELFLFGGEPFSHPFLNEIISELNNVGMEFMIQTNMSFPERMKAITYNYVAQVSVHPTQIKDITKFLESLDELKDKIRRVDVMYVGKESINYYKEIAKIYPREKLFLVPVADFKGTNFANKYLYEYNQLRQGIMAKVINFEQGERSYDWEEQQKGLKSYKGNPCAYKDKFALFDPMLRKFTCCYRENNDICPHDECFVM